MRAVLVGLLFSLISTLSLGQSTTFYTDRALGVNPLQQTPTFLSYAQVRVCSLPLTTTSPCTPVAAVTDQFGNSLSINGGNFGQLTTDFVGRFSFGCSPGNYQVQVAATGSNTPQLNYPVTCPSGTSLILGTANVWSQNQTFPSINNILYVDGAKYAQTGAGFTAAITDCLALASCPGVVVPYIPSSTVSSTITFTRAITLWLGQVNLTLAGSPGIVVNAAATGMIINGSGAGVSVLSCSAASTDCLRWLASSGVAQDFTLTVTTNTTNGLTLDASLVGQDIKFNNFKHLTLTTPSTNTADGIHAVAVDSTHKISFNHFENFNIVDFLNAQHFATTGTVGPTDNVTIGGQFRQTALRGSGVLLDAASQDNTWVGGNLSFYTTAINLAASATVTGNKFYGTVPESNTNGWSIGAGAADNELRGVPCGSQVCTDSGTRTIIDDGNNAIGPSGSAVQKQGAPFQNLTLISSSGFPVTLTNTAGAPLTANVILSMATGTATVDLASVASGACTADSADVTLTGAAVGDEVRVTAATALPAGVRLIGRVTASNIGRFQLCNWSGGAVDRASDTYTISVIK